MKQRVRRSNLKRNRTHGFRARMETADGRKVLARRRRKGRVKLSVSQEGKWKEPGNGTKGRQPLRKNKSASKIRPKQKMR